MSRLSLINERYILNEDLDIDIVELFDNSILDLNGYTLYVRSIKIFNAENITIINGTIVGVEQICPLYDLFLDKNSRISILPKDIVIKIATIYWKINEFPLIHIKNVNRINIINIKIYSYTKSNIWKKYSHYYNPSLFNNEYKYHRIICDHCNDVLIQDVFLKYLDN